MPELGFKHETLAMAMAAFAAEAPKLIKDERARVEGTTRDGRHYDKSYDFADLAQVTETLNPVLGKHGLSFTSRPTMTERGFGLEYELTHASGESQEGFWPLPHPAETAPQQVGIAITYARRYALMAVTNTFPDKEDTDGATPAGAEPPPQEEQRPRGQRNQRRQGNRQQAGKPVEQPAAAAPPPKTFGDDEVRELVDKVATVPLPMAVEGYAWMAKKGLHTREVFFERHGVSVNAEQALADRLYQEELASNDIERVRQARLIATEHGLTEVLVDPDTALGFAIEAKLSLMNARALETRHAEELRQQAAESWEEKPGE